MVHQQLPFEFKSRSITGTRRVFFARHAQYSGRDLTEMGKKDAELLAKYMKEILGEVKNGVYLVSSSAPRAEQTAEIISRVFGLKDFERSAELFVNGEYITTQASKFLDDLFKREVGKQEVIITVSHYGVVGDYPFSFVCKYLGREERIERPEKTGAIDINMLEKEVKIIP